MSLWIVLFVFLFLAAPVFADLNDLGDAVDEERRRNEEEKKGRDGNESEDDEESEDTDGSFLDVLITLTGLLWYYHNASTWYADYPYEETVGVHAMGHAEKVFDRNKDFRRYRFTFETTAGTFIQRGDTGFTVSSALSGLVYGLIGPDLEYRLWNDSSGNLNLIRLGILIPFVQHDYFSMLSRMAWAGYRGVFYLDGFALGAVFEFYPVRPLSFGFGGGGIFASGVSLAEWSAELGIHIRRFRISFAYSGLEANGTILHSLELGGAVHL